MDTKQRLHAVVCATLLAGALLASGAEAQAPPDQAMGFQLLDRLVGLVVRTAAPGGTPVDAGAETVALARELKHARDTRQVDGLFAVRYGRLLGAVRQAVLMDPEILTWPFYRYAMADFIEERTGEPPDWADLLFKVSDHGGAGVGLGTVAGAVMSEVVTLHLHLENASRRAGIQEEYLARGLAAVRGRM
jgi:hypothetical protein